MSKKIFDPNFDTYCTLTVFSTEWMIFSMNFCCTTPSLKIIVESKLLIDLNGAVQSLCSP